ncbi:MAG: transposase [Chloroflexi bacterium]|uniref:IS110 family transposase n=1 Tax=Candidatus Flexifilum breve TaxID=3140694 RepID=UPI003136ABBA|nr:transposase [Chloroflexota bacterium]
MFFLGIDWATDKHDVCLLDAAGTILHQLTIKQSHAGFEQPKHSLSGMEPCRFGSTLSARMACWSIGCWNNTGPFTSRPHPSLPIAAHAARSQIPPMPICSPIRPFT